MSRRGILRILAAVFIVSCSSAKRLPRRIPGRVRLGCTPTAPVRVAAGTSWVLAPAALQVEVGADGTFELPHWVGAANAYVDDNENGMFDRFAEPSSPCVLANGQWRCSLVARRTTVHRSTAWYHLERGIDGASDPQDSTFYYAEAFDSKCRPIADVSLCTDDGRYCSSAELPPFRRSTAKVQTISMCGEGDVGTVPMTFRTQNGAHAVLTQQPKVLSVSTRLDYAQASVSLSIDTGFDVDRVLVWAGNVSPEDHSAGTVLWNSEQSGFEMIGSKRHYVLRIPTDAMTACRQDDECALTTQVLRFEHADDDVMVVSEGRDVRKGS